MITLYTTTHEDNNTRLSRLVRPPLLPPLPRQPVQRTRARLQKHGIRKGSTGIGARREWLMVVSHTYTHEDIPHTFRSHDESLKNGNKHTKGPEGKKKKRKNS